MTARERCHVVQKIQVAAGISGRRAVRLIHTVLRWRVGPSTESASSASTGKKASPSVAEAKAAERLRPVRDPISGRNVRWSMDFVSDTLSSGRRFRCLTIIDEFSRECLAIHVGPSIPAVQAIKVMERLREEHGLPATIMPDNGSEFTSQAFDASAYARAARGQNSERNFPGVIYRTILET